MIYIIDDKKIRQSKDFGWTDERLKKFNNVLQPIYTLEELADRAEEVFKGNNNVVIYHESFLDNTSLAEGALEKRKILEKFIANHPEVQLAIFSGSKNTRSVSDNLAHLPVGIVYQNLEILIKKYSEGSLDLNYLVFGKNPNIEKELEQKLNKALSEIDVTPESLPKFKNLFIIPDINYIKNPIEGAEVTTIFDESTDVELTNFILTKLNKTESDNLFLPLCFGETMSDFNGLRLAILIRCTASVNQLKNIYIYSFVGIEYILESEYFNILRTKNVQLVNFKKKTFQEVEGLVREPLLIDELSQEISKLKLDPPDDYFDSHSIANEWGIFQMARNAGIDISEINGIDKSKFDRLYFKWLIAKNRLNEEIPDNQKEEQKQYAERLRGIKPTGQFIDLSKFKK